MNDPEDERYKNVSDVAEGGKEKAADLLRDFPELDGLDPYNDETMIGAVEALLVRAPGRGDDGVVQRDTQGRAVGA